MGRAEMCTPSEKNAEEKCLIKEKFQRELSGQGKEKTKGKQDKMNKGPLNISAQAFLHKAPPQAAGAAAAHCWRKHSPLRTQTPLQRGPRGASDLAREGVLPGV